MQCVAWSYRCRGIRIDISRIIQAGAVYATMPAPKGHVRCVTSPTKVVYRAYEAAYRPVR